MVGNTGKKVISNRGGPEITPFDSANCPDVEDWLHTYGLISSMYGWNDAEKLKYLELYLSGEDKKWFKRQLSTLTTWEAASKKFLEQFGTQETELTALETLIELRQANFKSFELFEAEFDSLANAAGIKEDSKTWMNLFRRALTQRNQVLLSKAGITKVKEAKEKLLEEEKLEKALNLSAPKKTRAPAKVEKKEQSAPKADTSLKENFAGELQRTLKYMQGLQLNILDRMEKLEAKSHGGNNRKPQRDFKPRILECFKCKKPGHHGTQCPEAAGGSKDLGCIELCSEMSDSEAEALFGVEKRPRSPSPTDNGPVRGRVRTGENPPGQVTGEIREVGMEVEKDQNPPQAIRVVPRNPAKDRFSFQTETNSKTKRYLADKAAIVRERGAATGKTRQTPGDKEELPIKEFSIEEEFNRIQPKLNYAHLLKVSPMVRKRMLTYIQKLEEQELGAIEDEGSRYTNCKAYIDVFGEYHVAILDTGAACSVVTNDFLKMLGLEIDTMDTPTIVTADGAKHSTLGIVSGVPFRIAGYIFTGDLLVMERGINQLVLGMDWLTKHGAMVDLGGKELILPKGDKEIALTLFTSKKSNLVDYSGYELYGIAKEVSISTSEVAPEVPQGLLNVLEKNKDLFVTDLMDLEQTDVLDHRIEVGDANPFDYEFQHVRGAVNPTDFLSRNPGITEEVAPGAEAEEVEIAAMDVLHHAAISNYLRDRTYPNRANDDFRKSLREKAKLFKLLDNKLCKVTKQFGIREVLHHENQKEKIREIHEEGHEGILYTLNRARNKYFGKGLREVVEEVVGECERCQKQDKGKFFREPLHPFLAMRPFEIMGIDFVGPINPIAKSGNKYVITAIDYLTKWPIAVAVPHATSEVVINFLFTKVVQEFGIPAQLMSDRGASFTSELSSKFYEEVGIHHTPTTVFRPQANGQVERFHRTFRNVLAKVSERNKEEWDTYIWKVLLVIRTMKNRSTDKSPAELLYGVKLQTPATWRPPAEVEDLEEEIIQRVNAIQVGIPEIRRLAVEKMAEANQVMKQRYDKQVTVYRFKEGDKVLRKVEQPSGKLEPYWEGPYIVTRVLRLGTYVIQDPAGHRDLVNGDRLKPYRQAEHMIPEITPGNIRSTLRRFKN
ncbi:Retrovirus-related Pol polyprotein from transposon [Zancudomyces culisetae]|uniref:Retrovirus-related Pol polyprotein from transposon n=1 Tax=Zancudomyces culisetae TaxID=1213189 RepID=A0A1R1PN02_ZANCU|nr:Retrovirus-related Pol polyprotein from transposon [Zancudomyces culisetae]|eukprot:OMH82338.1 Retrovirus-related Pol polyprotein from transposon [Zancudomyces culisetae]